MTYKIVRFWFDGSKRTRQRGLTLEQAQSHCNDRQTSSSTCTTPGGKRTARMVQNHAANPWFDGFTEEHS